MKHRWEDLAQTYSGETQIGTVDIAATAKGKELAARYHVESTPTFLLYALPPKPPAQLFPPSSPLSYGADLCVD